MRLLALWLAALLALGALAAAAPAVAHASNAQTVEAQESPDADTTPTDTNGTDTTGTEGTTDDEDEDDDALVAIAVLIFGALVLLMALVYLDHWRTSTTDLIKATLERTGRLPELEAVGAAVPQEVPRDLDTPEPVPLVVKGPALLQVGEAATFTATQGDAPVTVTWSLDPADGGTVDPASGDTAQVTAAKAGPLKVQATLDATVAEACAVAVLPSSEAGRVPLVGVGYGGIVVSIFALTLAGAATVYGKLDGAALVALAGAFVGYFFVQARGQQADAGGGAGDVQQQD